MTHRVSLWNSVLWRGFYFSKSRPPYLSTVALTANAAGVGDGDFKTDAAARSCAMPGSAKAPCDYTASIAV